MCKNGDDPLIYVVSAHTCFPRKLNRDLVPHGAQQSVISAKDPVATFELEFAKFASPPQTAWTFQTDRERLQSPLFGLIYRARHQQPDVTPKFRCNPCQGRQTSTEASSTPNHAHAFCTAIRFLQWPKYDRRQSCRQQQLSCTVHCPSAPKRGGWKVCRKRRSD